MIGRLGFIRFPILGSTRRGRRWGRRGFLSQNEDGAETARGSDGERSFFQHGFGKDVNAAQWDVRAHLSSASTNVAKREAKPLSTSGAFRR